MLLRNHEGGPLHPHPSEITPREVYATRRTLLRHWAAGAGGAALTGWTQAAAPGRRTALAGARSSVEAAVATIGVVTLTVMPSTSSLISDRLPTGDASASVMITLSSHALSAPDRYSPRIRRLVSEESADRKSLDVGASPVDWLTHPANSFSGTVYRVHAALGCDVEG